MSLALEGVSVLQDGATVAVAFAGHMLASYGATVFEVAAGEGLSLPPAPDPRVAEHLAAGKARVDIALEGEERRRAVAGLASAATIVLTVRSQPEFEVQLAGADAPPPPVAICVTPWGAEGPEAMRRASDLLLFHGGGLGAITPRFANNPQQPPLRPGFPVAEYLVGLNAAVAALAALDHHRSTGEPAVIDVSGQQAIAYALGMYSAAPAYENRAVSRVAQPTSAPFHFLPCMDGWIMVICPEEHQWRAVVELIGHPSWADSELFANAAGRANNWDAIEPFLVEWLSNKRAADVYRDAQALRIPLAPVSTMPDLLRSPQLAHRGFFAEATIAGQKIKVPGVPFRSTPALAAPPGDPASPS